MKAGTLREQSDEELQQLLTDAAKEMAEMRIRGGAADASHQPLRIRTLRRDIARIKTLLRERGGRQHV